MSQLKEQYINEGKSAEVLPKSGSLCWHSPSNIALVKYWGKHGEQLPGNASLSITLQESVSILDVEFRKSGKYQLDFFFEGERNEAFAAKLGKYLHKMKAFFPFLNNLQLRINSRNSFPHSAGIASSASFMSAVAMMLCSLEQYPDSNRITQSLRQKASFMARLGSGSASRSVFPSLAAWGRHPVVENSSDEFAVETASRLHPEMKNMHDAVIIVDSTPKKVSSSKGHELMNGHFLAENRLQQAFANFASVMDALEQGNWETFITVVENEALSLHAMMLSSVPGFFLLKQQTLDIIDKVREFRNDTGSRVAFTLDAGPNVHLLYAAEDKKTVEDFINSGLKGLAENDKVIYDRMGSGPVLKVCSYE